MSFGSSSSSSSFRSASCSADSWASSRPVSLSKRRIAMDAEDILLPMIWAELVIDAPEAAAETVAAYVSVLAGGVEIREHGRLVAWVEPAKAEQWIADLQTRFEGVRVAMKLRDED